MLVKPKLAESYGTPLSFLAIRIQSNLSDLTIKQTIE